MRESQVESKVCKFAESMGWLQYKWSSPGNRGVPDRVFFRAGKTVAVEFKKVGAKPSVLQILRLMGLKKQGVTVAIIEEVEQGQNFFRNMGKKIR